ncbi:sugar phosphate nucleotidyltransferase [[Eubacterium] cellulosolvens]
MKGLILAGGFGTRLRPLSCTRPKLLFPIAGRTMLEWILKNICGSEVEELILAVNYLAEILEKRVGDKIGNTKITYSLESKSLGTAGPVKNAEKDLQNGDTFLTMNGDILAEIPLKEMLEIHLSNDAIVTVALHKVQDPSMYGVVEFDEEMHIKKFVEKPKEEEAPSRWINAGIYLMEPNILKYIKSGKKVSLEKEIFPVLVKEEKLYGYKLDGIWFDVGNLNDYKKANYTMIEAESKNQILSGKTFEKNNKTTLVSPSVIKERVMIGDNSEIGPNSVIGHNSKIGKRSTIKNSILFEDVSIGESAKIENSIIGGGVCIGNNVTIGRKCVISDYVEIHDGISISEGAIICPYKEIEENISVNSYVL